MKLIKMEFSLINRSRIIAYHIMFYLSIFMAFLSFNAIGGRSTGSGGMIEEFGYGPNSPLYIYSFIVLLLSLVGMFYFYDKRKDVNSNGVIKIKENVIEIKLPSKKINTDYVSAYIKLSSSLGKAHENRSSKEARGNWIEFEKEGKKYKYEFYIFSREEHLKLIDYLSEKPLKKLDYFEIGNSRKS